MRNLILLAPLALAACGPDLETACENYITAANDCTTEYVESAGGTATELDPESTCSVYDGMTGAAAQDAADLLQCYADAYGAADCSTAEGYTAAGTDVSACVTG